MSSNVNSIRNRPPNFSSKKTNIYRSMPIGYKIKIKEDINWSWLQMSNNWDPFIPLNRFYKLPNPSHVWSSLIIISPPHLYERERSAGKENFNILYDTYFNNIAKKPTQNMIM